MKHTEGEWKVVHSSAHTSCQVFEIAMRNPKFEEKQANAKLIEAAPKLLKELNHIIERISIVRGQDAFCQALKDRAINAVNETM